MNQQTTLFSNEKLMAMIIPLFLEQLLIMLVGMADTLVVSYAGEAAVSGVSLVNQFNTIFIYLFTALASGGAVVISQYIGRKKNDDAGESASQLLSFSTIFSILRPHLCYHTRKKKVCQVKNLDTRKNFQTCMTRPMNSFTRAFGFPNTSSGVPS